MNVRPESMGRPRAPYRGVLQIVRFNWPWYGLALFVCAAAGSYMNVARSPSAVVAATILPAACLAAFWSLASLGASHLVYDRSKISDGSWIDLALPSQPLSIANFHAGLDETSARLSERFPSARLTTFDFHHPDAMTEPSIRRARSISRTGAAPIPIHFGKIPLGDGAEDAAFVVFAAHELRKSSERLLFFQELRRVLRPGGDLVVVEHMRDSWNLLAFGPGAFHFLDRGLWLRLFSDAGFKLLGAFPVTPFVTVFRLRRV